MAAASPPHAVAIPFPFQGHVTPLLHLCRALASKGFVVTFINAESNQEKIGSILSDLEGIDFRFETVPDGLGTPIAHFDVENRSYFLQAVEDMKKPVEKLLEKISKTNPPISFILSDMFLTWTRDLAQSFKLPRVVFWTSTASSLLLDYHIPQLMANEDIPVKDVSSEEPTRTYIPGLSPLPVWSLSSHLSVRDEIYDPGYRREMTRLENYSTILINTYEAIEAAALEALRRIHPRVIALGPSLLITGDLLKLPSLRIEDRSCLEWLDNQAAESVLYISFGSIAPLRIEQMEEIAAGLKEVGRPFLWVIRPKMVLGVNDPEELLRRRFAEGTNGVVISWAPQLEVLKHSSIGGFLTHGGWNSVLESICCGVPMLCWPCLAEQNLTCKFVVEDWGIGLTLRSALFGKVVDSHEFGEAVGKLMGNPSSGRFVMKENVRKLKSAASESCSENGSSKVNLELFCENWIN